MCRHWYTIGADIIRPRFMQRLAAIHFAGVRRLDDPSTLFTEYNAVLRHKYENRPESLGRFGLFFGFVKDFSRFLRVLRYLVAERVERIKDSFGADVLKKSYLNILSVEVAGEVGYAGLAAQIVAGK